MFGRDWSLRKKLFGRENQDCLNLDNGDGILGVLRQRMDMVVDKHNTLYERTNAVAGVLLQVLPAKVLNKKLKAIENIQGCNMITEEQVDEFKTIKRFITEYIDP